MEDAESSGHCFLDWFIQTRPPCLSHLCFSLGAAGKESCVPVQPSVVLPSTPDSGGMAASAKDAPSKSDMNFLKRF